MFESGNTIVDSIAPLLVALVIVFAVLEYFIYKKKEWVATALTLAERDFNNNVASGLSHGSRRDRVAERREWNEMLRPENVQVNKEGYKNATFELIAANEKELMGKGTAMGKASTTAFLLKELYEGNVDAAQNKIFADFRNSGSMPYIAPGIDKLVGLSKFDEKTGFPENSGVPKWLLKRTVRDWGYPREIRMVKTDDESGTKSLRDPFDALNQLIQQNL